MSQDKHVPKATQSCARATPFGIVFGDCPKCPDPQEYTHLYSPTKLGAVEKQGVSELVQGVDKFGPYTHGLYVNVSLSNSGQARQMVVKALAMAIIDNQYRLAAVEGLLKLKKSPPGLEILQEISKSYPMQAIREKADEILKAPELSEGCPLVPIDPDSVFGDCVYYYSGGGIRPADSRPSSSLEDKSISDSVDPDSLPTLQKHETHP